MIPDARLQEVLASKDHEAALEAIDKHPIKYSEGWAIIDGALIVYNIEDPPGWLKPVLEARDEDGYTPEGIEHATQLEEQCNQALWGPGPEVLRDSETIAKR